MPPSKRKIDPVIKTTTHKIQPSTSKTPWRKILLLTAGLLLILGFLFTSGILKDLTAGPKTPLPRAHLSIDFGTSLNDVKAKFPGSKDRSFNNDPSFRILTLKGRTDMPEGSSEAELIFFERKLYFASVKWDDPQAGKLPFDKWTQEFRRWKKKQPDNSIPLQNAGSNTVLKEWYFEDNNTEMVLRDLRFNSSFNRWKDLRDASNQPAQQAFAKYRFDLQ